MTDPMTLLVAASATAIQHRFDSFSRVGNIIGTSVSAAFLIILGIMNIYIFYKIIQELRKMISAPRGEQLELRFDGVGCVFSLLRKLFRLVDRYFCTIYT